MEIIFKTVNAGKTTEALALAAMNEGRTLVVSNEMLSSAMSQRLMEFPIMGEVFTGSVKEPHEVEDALAAFQGLFGEIDMVVLDVNFVVTHSKWFKLAQKLEDEGYYVVGTQQLVRFSAKTDETPVIKVSGK